MLSNITLSLLLLSAFFGTVLATGSSESQPQLTPEEIADFIKTAEERRDKYVGEYKKLFSELEKWVSEKERLERNIQQLRAYQDYLRRLYESERLETRKLDYLKEIGRHDFRIREVEKELDGLAQRIEEIKLRLEEVRKEIQKAARAKMALKKKPPRPPKPPNLLIDEGGSIVIPRRFKIPELGKGFCKKIGPTAATCGVIAFDIAGLWWLSKEEKDALERFNKCMEEKLGAGLPEEEAYLACHELLEKSVIGNYFWYYFNDRLTQALGSMGLSEIIGPLAEFLEKKWGNRYPKQEEILKELIAKRIRDAIKNAVSEEELREIRVLIFSPEMRRLLGRQARELSVTITKRQEEIKKFNEAMADYLKKRGIPEFRQQDLIEVPERP